jgi:hypothetical protein
MTAQRQDGSRRILVKIAPFALIVALGTAIFPPAGQSATTERIVVNRFSGLAIEGFDPVAYFVEGQSVRGLPEFEAMQGGAVWRFHNEGNRASFMARPDIYGPQFGGYDPIGIARGITQAGNPMFFVLWEQRLYLFSGEANRDAFAADPASVLSQAHARWLDLERGLSQ